VKVLLLHAFPFDERMWEPQRDALAGHEVVTPHLYGLGNTMDEWARAIPGNSLLQGEQVAVVGASMGGYCAQRLLAVVQVRALVLVGARAGADAPERRQARDETIRLLREEGAGALWDRDRPLLFPEDADELVLARARKLVLEQDPDELATGVAAMRDRPDSTELLRDADVKLLIARGEHDPFLPADEAEGLAASARDGTLHTFAGCGHLPSLEQPAEFNRVLEEFLAGV
jgi:pimeloyl-ACP methyl ester carboxylesterase